MYYTCPSKPLGTPSPSEDDYHRSLHINALGCLSIRDHWTYIGTKRLMTGKGEKEVYVYQVGGTIIALDCVVQCLWNVGNDKGEWHFSHVSTEPATYEKHVKMMVDACSGLLTDTIYDSSCAEWKR